MGSSDIGNNRRIASTFMERFFISDLRIRGYSHSEMRAALFSLILAVGLAVRCLAQAPVELQRKFDEAERRIVRLPPADFKELPSNLVRELERRSCSIPQDYTKERGNVIRGDFKTPGQTGWAVLCSVNGFSSILVFWKGSEDHPAEMARAEDRTFLQVIGDEEIGFSRRISAVGKHFIMRHYRAYGGPAPPPIDHQSINHMFLYKNSVVFFFHRPKWLCFNRADLRLSRG